MDGVATGVQRRISQVLFTIETVLGGNLIDSLLEQNEGAERGLHEEG